MSNDQCRFLEQLEDAHSRFVAFCPPLTETTANSGALFFLLRLHSHFYYFFRAQASVSLRGPLPLHHLMGSHFKWSGSCYSHCLNVMRKVKKFHTAGTNCPEASERNCNGERGCSGGTGYLGTSAIAKWPLPANVHHFGSFGRYLP